MKLEFEGRCYNRIDVLLKDIEGDELSGELIVNDNYSRTIIFVDGVAQVNSALPIDQFLKGMDRGLQ